ncbi:MAG: DUF5700 domain-containing putative Zn-dependent protease [Candidatus Krumholzibacteriia bacterium]
MRSRAGRSAADAAAALVAAGLLLGLAACGSGEGDGDTEAASGAAGDVVRLECPVVITTTGLEAFLDLTGEIQAENRIPPGRKGELASLPIYDLLLRSYDEPVPAELLDRLVLYATVGRTSSGGLRRLEGEKLPANTGMIASMGYVVDNGPAVTAAVERLIAADLGCKVAERARGFVPAADIPDPLRIDFLAADAELRFFEDRFLVDAGLAAALDVDQLERALASSLYRKYGAPVHANPVTVEGAAALHSTWGAVVHGGVGSWIDEFETLYMDTDHPRLSRYTMPVPEEIMARGVRQLGNVIAATADALADTQQVADGQEGDRGLAAHKLLAPSGGYSSVGFAMARLIERRLGEERLRSSANSVAAFLTAYQEAALRNPDQPTSTEGSYNWYLERMPAFPPDVFERLLEVVREQAALLPDPAGSDGARQLSG